MSYEKTICHTKKLSINLTNLKNKTLVEYKHYINCVFEKSKLHDI